MKVKIVFGDGDLAVVELKISELCILLSCCREHVRATGGAGTYPNKTIAEIITRFEHALAEAGDE